MGLKEVTHLMYGAQLEAWRKLSVRIALVVIKTVQMVELMAMIQS